MTHILVIDDDPLVRRAVDLSLKSAGFTTATAENGRVGLAKWQANRPDLVITDFFMPVMEGVETILRLRQLDPDLPVLAISTGWQEDHLGTDRPALLKLAARLGATETLAKPFSSDELLGAVGKCLSPSSKAPTVPDARFDESAAR